MVLLTTLSIERLHGLEEYVDNYNPDDSHDEGVFTMFRYEPDETEYEPHGALCVETEFYYEATFVISPYGKK